MEQEGPNLIESQGTDNSPTPEGQVVQEPSNQVLSEIQEALNTVAPPKMMEQIRDPYGVGSMATIFEQQRTLGLGSIAKMVDQQRTAFDLGRISKIVEQQRTLGLGSIAKMVDQHRTAFDLGSMAKIIEQQRSTLGFGSIAKAMDNLSSHASSALARASLENLLDELQERTAEASPSSLIVAPKLKEPTLKVASEALEKKDLQSLTKSRKLALVPTWTLIALINSLILSAYVLENWDAIRLSIVDINSRAPNTETFSEARKYIRMELAGKPGDVRLVSGKNVNLREDPGMKSRIILSLPENSPVIVLGKEDRTWLYVSYEHQGYWIDGYVSTKHLKKIRKDLTSR